MGKAQGSDAEFKAKCTLGAVNSINWARILAQIVYYFSAYYQWLEQDPKRECGDEVTFVVPTGNFGNALAGYYARSLGLPIKKIVVATNANDILHRFISKGDYAKQPCKATLAPAMDITIPSNFERYLYVLSGKSGEITKTWMETVASEGTFDLGLQRTSSADVVKEARLTELRKIFDSAAATDDEIRAVQNAQQEQFNLTHCPHTACGIYAAEQVNPELKPFICMATAHHAKFGVSLDEAEKMRPALPPQLKSVEGQTTRLVRCPNSSAAVRAYLLNCVVGKDQSAGSTSGNKLPGGAAATKEIGGACGMCVVS